MRNYIDNGNEGVALCSVVTIKVLRKVPGKIFVMVLLYHSSDRGWFQVLARFVLRGFCSVVPYSVVKKKGRAHSDAEYMGSCSGTKKKKSTR